MTRALDRAISRNEVTSGVWTPSYKGETTAGVTTHTYQSGSWLKIGKVVYFELIMTWSNATGTGRAIIDGLPFAAKNGAPVNLFFSGVSVGTDKVPGGLISSQSILMYSMDSAGGIATSALVDINGELRINGMYLTN